MKHAFHIEYKGKVNVLVTPVRVALPFQPGLQMPPTHSDLLAIWDTGATGSAITKKVVDTLGLRPTGLAEVHHAQGKSTVNTYLVSIALPNCDVVFNDVRVTEVDLIADGDKEDINRPHLLIGMDIIGAGDFAVSCPEGKTNLTFRIPSSEKINFVPKAKMENLIEAKRQAPPRFQAKHKIRSTKPKKRKK